jgi:hypothetical protein
MINEHGSERPKSTDKQPAAYTVQDNKNIAGKGHKEKPVKDKPLQSPGRPNPACPAFGRFGHEFFPNIHIKKKPCPEKQRCRRVGQAFISCNFTQPA